MIAVAVSLAAVLAVATDVPAAFWVLIVLKPVVLGCALWFVYECLRNLILANIRH